MAEHSRLTKLIRQQPVIDGVRLSGSDVIDRVVVVVIKRQLLLKSKRKSLKCITPVSRAAAAAVDRRRTCQIRAIHLRHLDALCFYLSSEFLAEV